MYKFSAKKNAFYPYELIELYGNLPSDLVSVDEKTFNKYACEQPPAGKTLGATASGLPAWVDIPKPSNDEVIAINKIKKESLLSSVMESIKPLQYAVDLGISTNEERERIDILKKYAVDISRVDADKVIPSWPKNPVK